MFSSKQSHFVGMHFCQQLKDVENHPGSHFVKIFSSSLSFLMMSVTSQKRCPFIADFS